jgi:hypothetical protein
MHQLVHASSEHNTAHKTHKKRGIVVAVTGVEQIKGDIRSNCELTFFKYLLENGCERLDVENRARIREPEWLWMAGKSRENTWNK